MASMPAPFALPPNLVVVPFNTSNLEMLQRPIEFALAALIGVDDLMQSTFRECFFKRCHRMLSFHCDRDSLR
jgi:hypothetical protein